MSDNKNIEVMTVNVKIESPLKEYAELVFAYNMRDEIAVRGQLAVQKEFAGWLNSYLLSKLRQESEAIEKRIEDKKDKKVLFLQKEYGLSYNEAHAKVFGKPLVQAPATVVKAS